MALKTTLAQLEEVQAAITVILEGGQDVMNADKRVLFARLESLQKREDVLLKRYQAEQNGGFVRNTVLISRG